MFGERTYVEQVLRNLISNAGKYGTPGTTVDGRGRGDRDDEVLVRVLDRGIGVSAEEAEQAVRAVLPIAAGHADGVRCRDRPVRQPWPDHGDGRADLGPPPDGGGSEFGFSLPHYQEDLFPVASGSAGGGAG